MTSLLKFRQVFKSTHCAVIGMIHVPALPGTPFNKMKCSQIVDTACEEAEVYKKCGVDGVLVENMFDIPYVKPNQAGPELTSFMTRVCTEVKRILPSLPCGVQILAGNNKSALAVAAATGELLRYRRTIDAQDILVFADIKKKHCSHAITSDISVLETMKAAEFFQCDGIILTGGATGLPPSVTELQDGKAEATVPILLGSGITESNIEDFFAADAVIVGSSFKHGNAWSGTLNGLQVQAFMEKIHMLRQTL
ncbi:uncharacterized protein F13E9.13, mitochondrial isoform X3 [Dermacentor andersoni]|uniref:uncharacterized protein F13E9.13, mitochondrial isoform X3 n=1 Tax=Dermacentor andersoni TaxID=34620 RepID=UPI0024164D52|nr:uncharacterized protein F13E9.13, mitochondrial-like isoform X3 [Dermacentor andersoni]